jgi:hypothetical protein
MIVQIVLIFHPTLVHFVLKFVLVRVIQLVVVAVAVIVVDIVVIVVDIAVVADNNNRVGVIVLYIVEGPVVDNSGMEVPVGVDMAKHMARHEAEHEAEHVVKHMADTVDIVDIAKHEAEVDAVVDKWYRVVVAVQDRKGKMGMADMEDKEDKGRMAWVKAEMVAFYISGVDTFLGESAMVQNYSYHNILHSILAYIYHY